MKKLGIRQIILIGVLLALIVYAVTETGLLSKVSPTGDVGSMLGLGSSSESAATSAIPSSEGRRTTPIREINWAAGWDADPFFYAEAETTEAGKVGLLSAITGSEVPNMELGGISWKGNIGMALINGNVLQEGDRISGYQLTKIAFDHVILRRGTSIVRVSLHDE